MTQQSQVQPKPDLRQFIRRHWMAFAVLTVATIIATAGAANVLVWFVGNAQATGLVPATLNLVSIIDAATFAIYALIWELAIVGIPVALVVVAAIQWWRQLPAEEKRQYHIGNKTKRHTKLESIHSILFGVI
jgi:hypothetical protein